MILTKRQLESIKRIINNHFNLFILNTLGSSNLTSQEKAELKQMGFDPEQFQISDNLFADAYRIGKTRADVEEFLPDQNYQQWRKQALSVPLTVQDKEIITHINNSTSHRVQNLKNKFVNDTINKVLNADQQRLLVNSDTQVPIDAQQLTKELEQGTEKFYSDWKKIATTELNKAYTQGTVSSILENNEDTDPDDILVYCEGPLDGKTCKWCKDFYHDGNSFKIYKLSELLGNGSNMGNSTASWRPVVPPMHPNCYSKDTEVLTNSGWKYWPDVTLEDLFMSVDLATGSAEYVRAEQLIKVLETEVVEYKNQRFNLCVSKTHDHVVKYRKETKGEKHWTNPQFCNNLILPLNDCSFINTVPNWKGNNNNCITFANRTWYTKDYIEFMAWYLSEGNLDKSTNTRIDIHQTKPYTREKIGTLLDRIQIKHLIYKDRFIIFDKELYDYLKPFGLSSEKFIPRNIKDLNKNYIRMFLDIYALGDGHTRKGKFWKDYQFPDSTVYFTCSNQMASDLGELILKLGLRPSYVSVSPKPIQHHNGIYTSQFNTWIISENKGSGTAVSSTERTTIPYNDYVYDVKLSKYHTLFVRRQGKVTLSGNCRHRLVELPKGWTLNKGGRLTYVRADHHELNNNLEKVFEKRLNLLKAGGGFGRGGMKPGHKYLKRTGGPGSYKYWYQNEQGQLYSSDQPLHSATTQSRQPEGGKVLVTSGGGAGHKFVRRTGSLGDHRYWYQDNNGRIYEGKNAPEKHSHKDPDKPDHDYTPTKEDYEVGERFLKVFPKAPKGYKYLGFSGGVYRWEDPQGFNYKGRNAPLGHKDFNPNLGIENQIGHIHLDEEKMDYGKTKSYPSTESKGKDEATAWARKISKVDPTGVALYLVGHEVGQARHIKDKEDLGFAPSKQVQVEMDKDTYKRLKRNAEEKGFEGQVKYGNFLDIMHKYDHIGHLDFDGTEVFSPVEENIVDFTLLHNIPNTHIVVSMRDTNKYMEKLEQKYGVPHSEGSKKEAIEYLLLDKLQNHPDYDYYMKPYIGRVSPDKPEAGGSPMMMIVLQKKTLGQSAEQKALGLKEQIQGLSSKLDEIINKKNIVNKSLQGKTPTFTGYKLDDKYTFQGMNISIENSKGSTRHWKDRNGKEGDSYMHYDYGYIRNTLSKEDKDHVDCYVGPNKESQKVFIVHQLVPSTKEFDEDKVMLGFDSAEEAKSAYIKQYTSPDFFGSMTSMTIDEFKDKVIGKEVDIIKSAQGRGLGRGGTKSGHKYIKRTGGPGSYRYWYMDASGRIYEGQDDTSIHDAPKPEHYDSHNKLDDNTKKELEIHVSKHGVLPNEEWRPVADQDFDKYEVSNHGKVRNKLTGEVLKPQAHKGRINNQNVYHRVQLSGKQGKKNKRVHRLVASAFHPNPNEHPEVNHIDNNTQNNSVTNLEWIPREHNEALGLMVQHLKPEGTKELKKKTPGGAKRKENLIKIVKEWWSKKHNLPADHPSFFEKPIEDHLVDYYKDPLQKSAQGRGLGRGGSKAGHKYVKRTGGPGHYRYWYRDAMGGLYEGKNAPDDHPNHNLIADLHDYKPQPEHYEAGQEAIKLHLIGPAEGMWTNDQRPTTLERKWGKKPITAKPAVLKLDEEKEPFKMSPEREQAIKDFTWKHVKADIGDKNKNVYMFHQGKVIGVLGISSKSFINPQNMLFQGFFVPPEYQNQGIEAKLLSRYAFTAIEEAKKEQRKWTEGDSPIPHVTLTSKKTVKEMDPTELEAWAELEARYPNHTHVFEGKAVFSTGPEHYMHLPPFERNQLDVGDHNKDMAADAVEAYDLFKEGKYHQFLEGICGPKGVVNISDKEYFIKFEAGIEKSGDLTRNEMAYNSCIHKFFPKLGKFYPRKLSLNSRMFMQDYVPGAQINYGEPAQQAAKKDPNAIHQLALMNYIFGNDDRHSGNYILDNNQQFHMIDEGYTFSRSKRVTRPHYLYSLPETTPVEYSSLQELLGDDTLRAKIEGELTSRGIDKVSVRRFNERWEYANKAITKHKMRGSPTGKFFQELFAGVEEP